MMKTDKWAMMLVLATTFVTSVAQILYKKGVPNLEFSVMGILANYYILGGLFLYVIAAALLIISFRGGEVSVLYPIIATSYIWVSILSIYFLGETMNLYKWLGIISIISGIVFIGYGSKKTAVSVV